MVRSLIFEKEYRGIVMNLQFAPDGGDSQKVTHRIQQENSVGHFRRALRSLVTSDGEL